MSDLRRALSQHDIMLLQVIAESWGVDTSGLSRRQLAGQLANHILTVDWVSEFAELAENEQHALNSLLVAGGKMLATPFHRQFGSIRLFGPGRLVRDRPWTAPVGPAEGLWYRGLLFMTFEQTELGSQQVVFIPDDLIVKLPAPVPENPHLQLVPASEQQTIVRRPPSTGLVDDCCTVLAFTQRYLVQALPQPDIPAESILHYMRYKDRARFEMIWALALDAGLLHTSGEAIRPHAQSARNWLQLPIPRQAAIMVQTWLKSSRWNELEQTPGLILEPTGWKNDPDIVRQFALDCLREMDTDNWVLLDSFPQAVKLARPDFQRTGGEYDSWYIRDAQSGEYVMGFQHWDRVEGALLRFLVTGPLFWLELVELGEDPANQAIYFRPTKAGRTFAEVHSFPYPLGPTQVRIQVNTDATITVPAAIDSFTRFQVARLVEWEPLGANDSVYRYRLTPHSLERAVAAEISLDRAFDFLATKNGKPLPEPVKMAVKTWREKGAQVQVRQVSVLQVTDAAIMDQLRSSPKVRRYLGEPLGECAVTVKTSNRGQLVRAIAELGLLADVDL
ncbi:MAG: helicase-associated domain-containing protein [Anaerolineales bacterium]|nr:helicase-associated domain-containing protein [Anaerolineales bacterium]